MFPFPKPSRPLLFALLAAIFSIQCLPLILGNSLTNDEPYEITGGCYYWKKGDVITTRMQPPVAAAIQTLPLALFAPLEWPHDFTNADDRGYDFFFVSNFSRLSILTIIPRLMTLLFGLGIGWLLLIALEKESYFLALATLVAWALDPNLIAHSGIAKSDIPLAFFFFAAVLAFSKAQKTPNWPQYWVVGLLTGLAITTKVTGLCLFGVYVLLELFSKAGKKAFHLQWPIVIQRWIGLLGGALLWVFLAYLPGTLLLRGHRSPFSYFWDKITIGWRISQKGWAHFYFMGATSDVSNPLYLPVAFLVKGTIPFLILLALALVLWAARKVSIRPLYWIPPLVYILSVLPASNFGLRMLLPALPFLYLIAAQAAQWMWNGSSKGSQKTYRRLLIVLLVWLGVSLTLHYPDYLSYGNEALNTDQKAHVIGDADLDWGQDTKRLSQLAEEKGWKNIKLAYFAGVDPHYYGINWQPWTLKDLSGPQPGWTYLIDTSYFQLAPAFFSESEAIAHGWISHAKPTGRLGDTWFYYEIPGTPTKDDTPKIPSAPALKYYWQDSMRLPYRSPG